MNRASFIEPILREMERVWGPDGFQGTDEEYTWLESRYNVSEEEDVRWQLILEYEIDALPKEDRQDKEVMQFVKDDAAVKVFLEQLFRKYRSGIETYRAEPSE